MQHSVVRAIRSILWVLASLFIIVIMLVSFGDVMMRSFAKPISGAYEITEIALGAMIFAALPIVTLSSEHVSVTLLSTLTANMAWLRMAVAMISRGVTLIVFAYLGYRLWLLGNEFNTNGAAAIFAGFPLAPFAWFAAVMCWLSALAGLIAKPHNKQPLDI